MISTRRGTDRTLRRALALLLLLALGASAGEATAGTLRESWTHRERAQEADVSAHAAPDGQMSASVLQRTASRDAPEAPSAPSSQTSDHDHVGSLDHCGHGHGNAMPPSLVLVFPTARVRVPVAATAHRQTPRATTLRRPPRA